MKKFSIKIEGTTLKIVLEGSFGDEDIEAYGKEYGAAVSKIDPNQFTLDLDVRNMGVITPDKQEKLKQFFVLYKQQGFKTITLHIPDSAILSMQAKRLAKEVGISDFRIL